MTDKERKDFEAENNRLADRIDELIAENTRLGGTAAAEQRMRSKGVDDADIQRLKER